MSGVRQGLTPQYLSRLESYALESRKRLSAGGYAGTRRSTARGSSLEFSDYREYVPGDDPRRIDWNGAARFDRLYLKLFLEERQLSVHLAVDTSASMAADPQKVFAQGMLAASLAFLALKGSDRAGVYGCGERLPALEGLTSRNSLPAVADFLDGLSYGGNTRLSASLTALAARLRPGGLTVVFSDFFSEDGIQDGILALLRRQQQVWLVQVLGETERRPVLNGPVRLVDAETKEARDLEASPALLAAYEENRRAYEKELSGLCRRYGLGFSSPDLKNGLLPALKEILT